MVVILSLVITSLIISINQIICILSVQYKHYVLMQTHLRGDHLVGVEPDLDDVVDEGEEWREGERRHEQGYEAVLNH